MQLIFLFGPPASGKLTVARELAALTGYRVFHNHLVVDALLAVFDFGSRPFVELRERMWVEVMTAAAEYIRGMARWEDRMIILLDLDKALAQEAA